MNVKTTIMLSERYLRYAEKMVEEGVFPSVSSVIEASLALMMRDGVQRQFLQKHGNASSSIEPEMG